MVIGPRTGELVVAYQDRLYNAVLRLVGDSEEARELTQEAFTRGLMKLDSFRGDASPYTWLFRIAVNLAISHLRKVQRHRVFSLDAPARNGNGRQRRRRPGFEPGRPRGATTERRRHVRLEPPARRPGANELHGQVLAALGRLDAEYRAVLVMRDIEGFDYQQMADVLGLPLGTLKSRLFRAQRVASALRHARAALPEIPARGHVRPRRVEHGDRTGFERGIDGQNAHTPIVALNSVMTGQGAGHPRLLPAGETRNRRLHRTDFDHVRYEVA